MLFAKNGHRAVLDKLVGPTDSDHRRGEATIRQVLNHGGTKSIVENMVFHRADDIASAGKKFERGCVEWFDPTGVDHGGRDALLFEFFRRGQGEFAHVAERKNGGIRAMPEDFGFSDFEEARFLVGACPRAGSTRIPDGGRAFMVGNRPEHVDEFRLVLRLHLDQARHGSQVGDIEESVVGRSVVARETCAIHAKRDIEILQSDVMDNHVVGSLHECAVNREKGLHSLRRHSRRKDGGMFLRDAHIVKAFRMSLRKMNEPGPCRHGSRDGDDFVIGVRKVGELGAEDLRVCRGR